MDCNSMMSVYEASGGGVKRRINISMYSDAADALDRCMANTIGIWRGAGWMIIRSDRDVDW